jgi:hypothetical protein
LRLLVITTAYPNTENPGLLMYVHTRNLYYVKEGIDVTVLNFSSEQNYSFQGIPVITFNSDYRYQEELSHFP